MDELLNRLETPRLLLRPFTEEDYPVVYAISADPETTEYLYYWGRIGTTPESDAKRFLDYALRNWKKRPIRAREYCVIRKDTGEKIGDGSVEWVEDEPGTAEIGWILLPRHRGQGFATEMGRELCRAGFERLGADRIIAHCDGRNAPSYSVMERLHMRFVYLEKESRPEKRPGEKKGDERTYEITRTEWLALQSSEAERR